MKLRRRTYTIPSDAVWNAGRKKANVTKAITLLNRIAVDATGRPENKTLIDSLERSVQDLKKYKERLIEL